MGAEYKPEEERMMKSFGYAELDRLEGEVLPGRILMSTVGAPPEHGHQATVFYACQSAYFDETPGLLETGLLAQEARSTITCVPAVVHAT
jgi:hypothetical protein